MPFPYQSAVCKGSIWLGSGCGHCERCQDERAEMLRNQQRAAEKSDVHVASELSSQSAASTIDGHVQGLPVAGYARNVEQWKVDMVNQNKILEEKVLRRVDEHVRERGDTSIDGASVQIARRHVEDAFYRLNRAIMQPKRIQGDLE
ncbi:hypothetical protein B9J07_27705 [Sinorhizobium sp. LM21]|uniref:Acb2/Tad1 domain-containing protein n=1 Tax=Sinorhizobium sp. LM21 TaxID=1449788 RepID=UPI0005D90213|nr:hypothetical protein [Sinorhizobium sp. LM21]AJW30218.1 hypothetical protein pLM21S1_p100 [Sinorhizobium sp. LM21]OWZ90377.1 hypothetical protein B9J07_27705 [Sinorhizobium sp. LM21]